MATGKYYTKTLTLPNGKRKYFRGKTAAEATRKLEEAKRQIQQGIDISDNTTVVELAQLWFDNFKKSNLKENSLTTLRGIINRYILPIIGATKVRDVKPLHIQLIMNAISALSRSTQNKVLNALRSIFSLAVENGIIAKTPVIKTIKAGGPAAEQVIPLTHEQSDELLRATQGTRAYTFVILALYAGLRRSEILGLRWSDIDFDVGNLHVQRSVVFSDDNRSGLINEDMKTPAANRIIPLPVPVVAALCLEHDHSTSEYVLSMRNGEYLSESSFVSLWNVIRRRDLGFSVHPHQLRHTCITRWFEMGLDLKEIQYLAGHSTIEMTLSVYTHYDRAGRAEETAEKIRAATPNFLLVM